MSPAALGPLLAVLLVAGLDLWIYADAARRAEQGRPVTFRAGDFVLATPAAWAMACLLLSVVFLPLYLVARGP